MDKVAIKMRLESISKDVVDGYVSGQDSLTDGVLKVAQDNNLTTEEINRVSEMANVETFLRKTAESSTNNLLEFPLADAKEVIGKLNAPHQKEASVKDLADYMTDVVIERSEREGITKVATEDGRILFQEGSEDGHAQPRAQYLWNLFEKTSWVKEEKYTDLRISINKLADCANEFSTSAKQLILDGQDINKLAHWANEARPGNHNLIGQLFQKTAEDLHITHKWDGPEKLEKVAGPVGKDMIHNVQSIGGQPVQIINGEHPLIQILDTTIEQARNVNTNMRGYYGVNDTVKYLKGQVQNYLSQEHSLEVGTERS